MTGEACVVMGRWERERVRMLARRRMDVEVVKRMVVGGRMGG